MRSRSHLAFGGWLGKQYDPFIANQAAPARTRTSAARATSRSPTSGSTRAPTRC
jgi:hypothetical protein